MSSKYFGTRKCCHPQISDLVIRLVFFRESSRKIINKLTSRLPSCESSIPGRFALFECNSNDVRICKKISQESCHQEIMKPKSDIWGWQHLWGPKDLLNEAPNHMYRPFIISPQRPLARSLKRNPICFKRKMSKISWNKWPFRPSILVIKWAQESV